MLKCSNAQRLKGSKAQRLRCSNARKPNTTHRSPGLASMPLGASAHSLLRGLYNAPGGGVTSSTWSRERSGTDEYETESLLCTHTRLSSWSTGSEAEQTVVHTLSPLYTPHASTFMQHRVGPEVAHPETPPVNTT